MQMEAVQLAEKSAREAILRMNVITSDHNQDSEYSSRPKGRLKAATSLEHCRNLRGCNLPRTCNTNLSSRCNIEAAAMEKDKTSRERRYRQGWTRMLAAGTVSHPNSKMVVDSNYQNVIAKKSPDPRGRSNILISSTIVLAVLTTIGLSCSAARALHQSTGAGSAGQINQLNEYQLVSQSRGQAQLPCLIGKQASCGEPYFIAWYKLNATSRLWARIEARSRNEETNSQETLSTDSNQMRAKVAGATILSRPLADRVQLIGWSRNSPSISNCLVPATGDSSYMGQAVSLFKQQQQQQLKTSQLNLAAYGQMFDCAQLIISSLELADEGQYKCEVTFSESLDFDRCPASTITQLNVIARPNEPEILLNGRPIQGKAQAKAQIPFQVGIQEEKQQQQALALPTFKEGSQVRLECQSSGGKPSPRIEWFNLTTGTDLPLSNEQQQLANERLNDNDQSMMMMMMGAPTGNNELEPELQLMRSFWPIKRATYFTSLPSAADNRAGSGQNASQLQQLASAHGHQVPVTSSSITITVSRYDLRSRFICLVLPQQQTIMNSPQQQPTPAATLPGAGQELPASVRKPSQLAALLDQVPMLSATNLAGALDGPMLKWVKLNVLAKPTSASLQVIDVATNTLVRPNQLAPYWNGPESQAGPVVSSAVAKDGNLQQQQQQPFYYLQPNRLYAIQCLVESSRPRSQVAWFNRTSPIDLIPIQLDSFDYLVPNASAKTSERHRLSSFTRFVEQSGGTFRTISSLLLTTSYYDHFEELYCRISNEAFQFDELAQVAPILSAKIYVNYPPSIWLEASSQPDERPVRWFSDGKLGHLIGEQGRQFRLRCVVGANPLLQNTILQIEWLKDGRRIQFPPPTLTVTGDQQQKQEARVVIEKANYLHIPQVAGSDYQQAELSPLDLLRGSYAGSGKQSGNVQQPASSSQLTSARLLASSSLTIGTLDKSDAGLYSCQYKLIPAPATSNQHYQSKVASQTQLQVQQQMKIVSGQANQSIQLTVIEAKLPVLRIASSLGLLVYDKLVRKSPGKRTTNKTHQPVDLVANYRRQNLEVVVTESQAELSLNCDFRLDSGGRVPLELGHKVIWYLDGVFLHSSSSEDTYNFSWESRSSSDQWKRVHNNNGGRLTCAHQMLESSSAANFHANSMRLYNSANAIQLRFELEPKLVQTPIGRELMPNLRSFSKLELSSQPANKLKLVCLAQCEPLCSIDWLVNKRPLVQVGQDIENDLALDDTHRDQAYTSARRLSLAGDDRLSFAQIEVQDHGKLNFSSWRKQMNFVPSNELQFGPAQSSQVVSQLKVAGEQLMREAHELQMALGRQMANVYSKLELNYSQLSQLLLSPPQIIRGDQREPALQESGANDGEDAELIIECKLSKFLNGQQEQGQKPLRRSRFGHAHVPARVWFPSQQLLNERHQESEQLMQSVDDNDDKVSDESASNLIDESVAINEHELENPNAFNLGPLNLTSPFSSTTDTLQTKIVLEKAPKRIYISLAGSRHPINEILLNEEQLDELLLDEEAAAGDKVSTVWPTLRCQASSSDLLTQYKWTFSSDVHGQGANEQIVELNKQDLNLKHLVTLRKRQLELARADSLDTNLRLNLIASIFGSYTCHLSTPHELVSTTLSLKYQGRPVCKLTISGDSRPSPLGREANEPSRALRCHIYSSPKLLETIWLQNNGQEAANKTLSAAHSSIIPFQPIVKWLSAGGASENKLPVQILKTLANEQQQKQAVSVEDLPRAFYEAPDELTSNHLASSPKCMARNSIGYSDACTLGSATTRPDLWANSNTNKSNYALPIGLANESSVNLLHANMNQQVDKFGSGGGGELKYLEGQLNAPKMPVAHEPSVRNWLVAHIDWLLIGACSLLLFGFVIIFGGPLLGCRLQMTPGQATSASHTFATTKSRKFRFNSTSTASLKQHQQPWRFQSASRASSANEIGLFANNGTNFHLANSSGGQSCFYGGVGLNSGSNGGTDSSEHDMVQSCSQSSHYEDFIQHQLQQRLATAAVHQQQQSLCLNQPIESTTLSRRPPLIKSSLSSSPADQSGCMTTFRQPIHSRLYGDHQVAQPIQNSESTTIRTNNVPLVSGARNTSSRIQLNSSSTCNQPRQSECQPDDCGQYRRINRSARYSSQLKHTNRAGSERLDQQEHIYDDIIYNRMLL